MAGYVERGTQPFSAGAIALHKRDAKPHRATPYLLI